MNLSPLRTSFYPFALRFIILAMKKLNIKNGMRLVIYVTLIKVLATYSSFKVIQSIMRHSTGN